MGSYLMKITDEEFQLMRDLIYSRFGINLTDQKRSLLIGRLQKLIRTAGLANFQEYYDYLINDPTEQSLGELIDRVSTNHTYFNREKNHFDYFSQTALPTVVARLEKEKRRDLRIWCAGCSTGEEPYMLLMLMHEFFGNEYDQWNAGILATDISQQALAVARTGSYPDERISSLPRELKSKYFHYQADGNWTVNEQLKNEATFRRFNLMNSQFPFKDSFDIIFCRNVMIYFDRPTRETLVRKFHQFTQPDGYLFIGHSETLGREQDLYQYLLPAAYQRKGR